MAHVDNVLGNLLIKYHDRWRGNYYLKADLSFGVDRDEAARFYLLKSGNTAILNGDRVSIHTGNRTLVINDQDKVQLVDREQVSASTYKIHSFIISNGTENTDPIVYESAMFIICDKQAKTALKYEWGMELIINQNEPVEQIQTMSGASILLSNDPSNYRPQNRPNLINSTYNADIQVGLFRFSLERADASILNVSNARAMTAAATLTPTNTLTKAESFDNYRGAIMVVLLLIILILCVLLNR